MWDYGIWYWLCDVFRHLRFFLTWPARRFVCLWLGHDADIEYWNVNGAQVMGPVKGGYTLYDCERCGATREEAS
jgi:hypothetical protein